METSVIKNSNMSHKKGGEGGCSGGCREEGNEGGSEEGSERGSTVVFKRRVSGQIPAYYRKGPDYSRS